VRTASEIGKQIADNIEQFGHFQGDRVLDDDAFPVCVTTAPAFPDIISEPEARTQFLRALGDKAGFVARMHDSNYYLNSTAQIWNDNNPTETVLETLRNL